MHYLAIRGAKGQTSDKVLCGTPRYDSNRFRGSNNASLADGRTVTTQSRDTISACNFRHEHIYFKVTCRRLEVALFMRMI